MKKLILVAALATAMAAHAQTEEKATGDAGAKPAATKADAKMPAAKKAKKKKAKKADKGAQLEKAAPAAPAAAIPAPAAPQAAATSAEAPATAAGALATDAAAAAPAESKSWGAYFLNEDWATQDDIQNTHEAPVLNQTSLGLNYKLNEAVKVEGRAVVQTVSNRDQLIGDSAGRTNGLGAGTNGTTFDHQATEMVDPMLLATWKTKQTFLGSDAITHQFRYEMPFGKISHDNKRNGLLRYDTSLNYHLSPKWEVDVSLSPRVYLNSADNPKANIGSDAVYRLAAGPYLFYAVTDNFKPYVAYTTDYRSTKLGRSTIEGDVNNQGEYDIGFTYDFKINGMAFTLNPEYESDVDLNDRSGSLGEGSRAFLDTTATYYLALIATY